MDTACACYYDFNAAQFHVKYFTSFRVYGKIWVYALTQTQTDRYTPSTAPVSLACE